MSKQRDEVLKAYRDKITSVPYVFTHYKKFDYSILKYIPYVTATGGKRTYETYNDVIIMADTESSKKQPDEYDEKQHKYVTHENHIVAWTISIRAFGHNIATLWGRKPSRMAETILRIHEHMSGMNTVFYWHNMGWDHIFMRKFMYKLLGSPKEQLNVKPYYPIFIKFYNGIIFKDSLILAQRKLEKWADDLDVEHKKAVGSWDYEKFRNQDTSLTPEELRYIECDTLAGVECIDATLNALNKRIHTIPLTATGIPREQTRIRGKENHAKSAFNKQVLNFKQYVKFTQIYHGGFTHGDRHHIGEIIDDTVQCFDFASSYPYSMLAFKYPAEQFMKMDNCDPDKIIRNMENYAFAFKFIATNVHLKTDAEPMPCLQMSKCIKTIHPIQDNGRILAANYVEIYLNEYDLAVIDEVYTWSAAICCEVEFASKDYLPRWFTDYVYECFRDKTRLKGGDPVQYSIAKAKLNALYGMCCMKNVRQEITEDYETGEYQAEDPKDPEAEYNKYVKRHGTILLYQTGVWVTSIAFYNLRRLTKCCRMPLYSDTDSCYGVGWDPEAVKRYNDECKARLRDRGYEGVLHNGREYWLGVAETDGDNDKYTEFRYMGAKRYCGRCLADGELHITVAGVPKKKGAACLQDDIHNFMPGFIFDGATTGKTTHTYFFVDDIYIDDAGNETGDSISLTPCDYKLDSAAVYDWEELFCEDVEVQIYEYTE